MFNPIRRNRNIGTAKQGIGLNNAFVIPRPMESYLNFYERLNNYTKETRKINNHEFVFILEEPRKDSFHACSINDISKILQNIPESQFGNLKFIVLRQPKRKEEIKSSVWGRIIYSYEFENEFYPAIILEAQSSETKLKWDRKLAIDDQKELLRLKDDGHIFTENKRKYVAKFDKKAVRNTQLYRTLIHEIGHYVHYLNVVLKPLSNLKKELDYLEKQISDEDTSESNPLYDNWKSLDDKYNEKILLLEEKYFSIPQKEKELFAHNYADKLKRELTEKGIIPFEIIE